MSFFGLLLLAGVNRSKGEDSRSLWSEKWSPPYFGATMSHDRFVVIMRCFSFDDRLRRRQLKAEAPSTSQGANAPRDKLAPIRTVFDAFVSKLKVVYTFLAHMQLLMSRWFHSVVGQNSCSTCQINQTHTVSKFGWPQMPKHSTHAICRFMLGVRSPPQGMYAVIRA